MAAANDAMAELCRKHPDRFPAGAAALAMRRMGSGSLCRRMIWWMISSDVVWQATDARARCTSQVPPTPALLRRFLARIARVFALSGAVRRIEDKNGREIFTADICCIDPVFCNPTPKFVDAKGFRGHLVSQKQLRRLI